jgi:hypothetical protein
MPIRIIHQVALTVSEDLAEPQKQLLFKRDLDFTKQTIDTYAKQASQNFNVPDLGDETYAIGDIDSPAKGLYLEVSADCTVYLSGSTDGIILRLPPTPQSGAKAKLFVEADVTSLRVVASEGAAVAGTFCFWGGGTT